jgi:TonB-linked SusC/RagA family outer membrane protein
MRQQRSGALASAGLWALALLGLGSQPVVGQQQATISGRVTSDRGDPLAGATVIINSTNFGGATNASGAYTITISASSARGQTVTLTARALGFKPISRQITLNMGLQEQNFELAADPLRLDELVVTGVSEATSTKKLTFAVGRVSEEQLQIAPAVTALGALQGKVAGVQIVNPSGLPGAAPQIRLRGSTSITGNQNPLIIIDGTITRFSLADIASEDIERVEVIKGAAATSLYGSDAANGVIQIFTKRGANLPDGRIQVTARGEFGQSFVSRRLPTTKHHAFLLLANGAFFRKPDSGRVLPSVCTAADNYPGGCPANRADIQNKEYPYFADIEGGLYEPGSFFTQYVTVGQHRGRTNFNASFQNTENQGSIFALKGFRRQNYRVNVDQVLSDNIDLSFNAFYGRSDNDEPSGGQDGGPFFSLAFLEPHIDPTAGCTRSGETVTCPVSATSTLPQGAVDIGSQRIGYNPDGSPYNAFIRDKRSNAANPFYDLWVNDRTRVRSRFSGGGRLRWRPFTWLSAEGNYNYDQLNQEFLFKQPKTVYGASGGSFEGDYERRLDNNRAYNLGATATAVWRINGSGLFNNLGVTVKGAYLYEDQENHFLRATSQRYLIDEVPEFSGTDPATQRAFSGDESIRNRNAFGIMTLDFNEKIVLDGLIRRDGSSLFGPDARYATYWRASGALRVPQLLGWSGDTEFRIRGAYGTAGLRPVFDAQYEVLTPSGGSFVKDQLGNRNLRPAKAAEYEIGANLELWGGRLTVEYNYSEKETKDQLIRAPLLATTGFISQWQNVGALEAKAHELAIGAQVINSRDVAFQLTLTGDRVREVITDWPLPEDAYGDPGDFAGFFYANGVRLGSMRGQRWIRNIEELYDDPVKAAARGPGQAFDPAKYTINGDGYVVLAANKGTNAERPIAYVSCNKFDAAGACTGTTNIHFLGVAAPDFRVGLNGTLAYKRLALTGLLDWSQGGSIYNATAHWGNQDCADARCDQFNKAPEDQIAESFYQTGLYNGASSNSAFVYDASFVKIRELSVNYTFNRGELNKVGIGRWINELRVGIIGRNLFTFTDYPGIDPDVAPAGDDAFRTRADWFQYPQFRTFTAHVEIAF